MSERRLTQAELYQMKGYALNWPEPRWGSYAVVKWAEEVMSAVPLAKRILDARDAKLSAPSRRKRDR